MIHECPYDDVSQMFDINGIIQSFLPQAPQQVAPKQPEAVQPEAVQPSTKSKSNKKKK